MTKVSPRKKIVVAVDTSDYAEQVMKAAYDVAENLNADVEIVTVIETVEFASEGELDVGQIEAEEKEVAEYQKKLIDTCFSGSTLLVESAILHGNPAKKICEFANRTNASIVVIGTRGFGKLQSKLLGSVSEKVIKNCHCSVLMVRK
ncbi:MAG: universal stress protein [Nitrosopumilales archaeon]|nr:MAG: universal stress protein [Nitrosopumilales archaeon]